MANPFLMEDEMDGIGADPAVNPFLMQTDGSDAGLIDNPFAGQVSNPFAFGDDAEEAAPPASDIDAAMSFFGTTIEAEDDTLSIKSTAEEEMIDGETQKKGPPPRPVPPQTQELINTVSNQMDETSSELLGRIPATRSPSPVSMRDLHSPSPTPDSGLADLLDVSDSGSSANTQGFDVDLMGSGSSNDNPFGIAPNAIPSIQPATPMPSPAKQQPPRPPPPRPVPPRPAPPGPIAAMQQPPPRPTPPVPVQQVVENVNPQTDSDDLFDMFGTTKPPKPPPPKSNEDILSLFDKPTQSAAKPDLLSDDIVLEQSVIEVAVEELTDNDDPIFTSTLTHPDESTSDITSQPQAADHIESTMSSIAPEATTVKQRAPTPDIEITTVEDLPRSDDEEEPEPTPGVPAVVIETEPDPPIAEEDEEFSAEPAATITQESDQSPPTESAATTQAAAGSPMEASSDNQHSEPEQMDTGLDFAPVSDMASGAASANPFASPDEDEETFPPTASVTNIFAADVPEASNIFAATVAETIVPPASAINIFAADPEPIVPTQTYAPNIFSVGPDEFDAFSAKFDSVKKDNVSILDGFASTGAVTPTSGGDGK